jgi:hypothetical protein
MSKKPPPPPVAAAAAAAKVNVNIVPSTAPKSTLEQRQLAEFNEWVSKYNNYQHLLENYWRGRLAAEKQLRGEGGGGGGGNFGIPSKSKRGQINTDKWRRRYQELVSTH